jgi:2-oxoisovalerate dehydrogenase E2 component (dihydrolipoyl transacylase)
VGTSLVTLEVGDDVVEENQIPKEKEEKKVEKAAVTVEKEDVNLNENILTVPAVRRLAKENNIDLRKVTGTGAGGRILKEDVLRFMNQGDKVEVEKKEVVKEPVMPKLDLKSSMIGNDTVHKITGIQRMMVKSMAAAVQVPAFGLNEDINMNHLIHLRNLLKGEAQKHGIKLSFLPFLIKSASQALKEYPIINSYVNEECTEVLIKAEHNIGIAMDTPRGLLVPNVKRVQDKSILEIAADLNRLQALGAEGKLGQDDLANGTFTLSNIGSIGGTYASPIIFVPQVAIGALGKTQVLPRYNKDGDVHPCSIMPVSWSADHRVIDGATMTRFSNLFKKFIEHPELLLLDTR